MIYQSEMVKEGIIAGCDKNQEWLLSLWWDHYSEHNSYPVAFADFGMSEIGLAWCRKRGTVFRVPEIKLEGRKEVSYERKKLWEEHYGEGIWFHREICLRKTFAFLQSPFPFSLWIDLDCRVRGSLDPLFALLRDGADIGMRREPDSVQATHRRKGFLKSDEINYNSGVVPYRQDAEIIRNWAREVEERSHEYIFDQHAFAPALKNNPVSMVELPAIYNWSPGDGPNPDALIYHFHGAFLKDPALLMFFS